MFIKILPIVLFIYLVIASGYIISLPGILLNNQTFKNIPNNFLQYYLCYMFKHFYKLTYYLADINNIFNDDKNNIFDKMKENPDKIDVVLCNHVSTIDFLMLIYYLNCFQIAGHGMKFILWDNLLYKPGIGIILYAQTDIKIKRKWEDDREAINKQIDNINVNNNEKQVILIFPEGTRMTSDKLANAQQFSKDNNLPIYNNLQVPKTKGTWTMIKQLNDTNKLGRVWDLSLIMPKYLRKSCYISDLAEDYKLGNVFTILRELDIKPIMNDLSDMTKFKEWFLQMWKDKDNLIDNYKTYSYKKLKINKSKTNNMLIISLLLLSILLLSTKYGRYYLLAAVIISYIYIVFRL